jgi:hypothetical protein
MKLKNVVEELTPQPIQEIQSLLDNKNWYLEQPRRWAQWLLWAIFAVATAIGLFVGIGQFFFR